MILFDELKFAKEQYIQDILTKVNDSLLNGSLTHEGIDSLSQDNLFRIWGVQYQNVKHIDFSMLTKDDFDKMPFSSSTQFPEQCQNFLIKTKSYHLNT